MEPHADLLQIFYNYIDNVNIGRGSQAENGIRLCVCSSTISLSDGKEDFAARNYYSWRQELSREVLHSPDVLFIIWNARSWSFQGLLQWLCLGWPQAVACYHRTGRTCTQNFALVIMLKVECVFVSVFIMYMFVVVFWYCIYMSEMRSAVCRKHITCTLFMTFSLSVYKAIKNLLNKLLWNYKKKYHRRTFLWLWMSLSLVPPDRAGLQERATNFRLEPRCFAVSVGVIGDPSI